MVAGLFLAVIGSYFYGYNQGAKNQRAVFVAEAVKKAEEGLDTHAEIEKEIMLSSDDELDKRISRWLRD